MDNTHVITYLSAFVMSERLREVSAWLVNIIIIIGTQLETGTPIE